MTEGKQPELFVVMGVSGSGKTTIGTLFAHRIGGIFADADDYHSPENKAKMHAGIPLTDEDRAPWLATLNHLLQGWAASGVRGVLACSALKVSYRETLSQGIAPEELSFIWLDLPKELNAARLAARKGTYMNPALLDSQLATLEPPQDAVRLVNDRTPDVVVDELISRIGLS